MNIETTVRPDGIVRRSGILVAAALLLACGVWSFMAAAAEHSVLFALLGIVALVASFGVMDTRRWARYAIHVFTLLLISDYAHNLYLSASHGDFAGASSLGVATYLASSLFIILLAVVSTVSVHLYFNALVGADLPQGTVGGRAGSRHSERQAGLLSG